MDLTIEPLPPNRLAPPRIAAVIILNSRPCPVFQTVWPLREAARIPANPASTPEAANTESLTLSTRIP